MMSRILRSVFSFPAFLGVLITGAVFLIAGSFRVDSDTWWHIVVGERILQTHSWPLADIYSSTVSGADWMATEWLGSVVVAFAFRLGGLRGLLGLLLSLSTVLMLLVYCYAYLRCRNPKAAFVATLFVLPLAGVWFSLHPQLLGYGFLVVTLICLELFRGGRRWVLWLLPGVFMLWVNTHTTFVLGPLVFGICWLSGLVEFHLGSIVANRWTPSERLQFTLVALLSLMASCLTPYGGRLAVYPLHLVFSEHNILTRWTSWQPIPFEIWHGKLFLVFVVLFVVTLATSQLKLKLETLALLLFAVVMTALHGRALPLFVVIFAPILATFLARWIPQYEAVKDHYALNAVLIVSLVVGLAKCFPSRQDLERDVAHIYPQQGVEYLRQHPAPGPMLNDLVWGGYLLHTLGPGHRVFIDGRSDFYEYAGVLADYLRIVRLEPAAPRLLRRYNVQSCFISPGVPLRTFLEVSPEWKKVYEDRLSVLFVRQAALESARLGP